MSAGSGEPAAPSTRESRGLAGDFMALLLGYGGRTVASLGTAIVLARLLAPEQLAPYSLFQMCLDLTMTFAASWTAAAMVRFGREELLREGTMRRAVTARAALVIALYGVAVACVMVVQDEVADFIGLPVSSIPLLAVGGFGVVAAEIVLGILQASGRFRSYSVVQSLPKVVFFAATVAAASFARPVAVETVVLLLVLSSVLIPLGALPRLPWRQVVPLQVDRTAILTILTYSSPILMTAVSVTVINWMGLAVIRTEVGPVGVGSYHMAFMGYNILVGVGLTFNALFQPKLVSLRVQGKTSAVTLYLHAALPLTLCAWGVVLTLSQLALPLAVPMALGDRYVDAVSPASVLIVAAFLSFVSSGLASVITAYDELRITQVVNVATAIVNVALNLFLVPIWGIAGAAWATVGSMLLNAVGCLLIVHTRILPLGPMWWAPILCMVPAVAFAVWPPSELVAALMTVGCAASALLIIRAMRWYDPRTETILDLIELPPVVDRRLRRLLRHLAA